MYGGVGGASPAGWRPGLEFVPSSYGGFGEVKSGVAPCLTVLFDLSLLFEQFC